jgi:predicted nuclease of predicted toxin-antitoxin system
VENGWQGVPDVDLLRTAVAQRRLVVTHDSDFGALAMLPVNRSLEFCTCGRPISTLDSRSKRSRPS